MAVRVEDSRRVESEHLSMIADLSIASGGVETRLDEEAALLVLVRDMEVE